MSEDVSEVPDEEWNYLGAGGFIMIILGFLAVLAPLVTGIGLSIMLGVILAIGGIVHFGNTFSSGTWSGAIWQVILAIVYILGGLSLLVNPVLGLTTLTFLLIIYLGIEGLVQILMGIRLDSESRTWFIGSGLISLILGLLLWIGFPTTSLWAIGLLFGLNLISTGFALILTAERGRKASEEQEDD